MRRTVLVLLASLAFGSLSSFADGSPMQVLSAPNLLRVGTAENIFVECQDCTGGATNVEIKVMNHPTKSQTLASVQVALDAVKHQAIGQITIPPESFSRDPNLKQYVYLQAIFPDRQLEKVVLASFQSGYIFIQTDKTLYTPNSKVHYRMFGLTPKMEPVQREGDVDASISIEIVTPEDIILPLDPVTLKSGIHSGDYQLPEIVSPGMWKVVAKFHSNPQQSYSAEFEVKEYVLPSFEVKLTPISPFFYIGSPEFTVNIKATYLFGEEVQGTAFVVFGAKQEERQIGFPASLQRVLINNGEGVVTLKREHITQAVDNIDKLVGSFIFVSVSVLTESGSEMVEAELRNIPIVTSPYTITFKKTPKYYKPGMSFDVTVEVTNPDGTPANGIPVEVTPGPVQGNTVANGMARLTINTEAGSNRLQMNARTKKQGILDDQQARATMTAVPYTSRSNNFIHISVDADELKMGDNMKVNLNLKRTDNGHSDITWLVMSRGQLVDSGRYPSKAQVLISLIIPVTKEMLPSFRIIAYYHTSGNEVVSDSVWVDVEDSCMGSLRLESSRPAASYEPRRMFGLKVTGDPGATVGLVAVDKGVYVLNNKHRLTQKKVWDTVEKYDTGCTAGGGKDGMGVFFDAGLLFTSSTNTETPYRQELKCPAPSRRRKRSTTIMEVTDALLLKYQGNDRDCCRDGLTDTPALLDCQTRSTYVDDTQECIAAFLDCCTEFENQRAERKEELLQLARSDEDDNSYMDSDEIVSRTKFPESWLWVDISLPECHNQNPNCLTTSFEKKVPLQDSITTWQFTGVSLSRTHGLCVSDPFEVIVRKDFFIDLRLPYSAVRGEQLEVKAILHNYSPDDVTVRVDLMEEEHVCSVASKHRRYRQEVSVRPQSTRSVPFILIPMKEGKFNIEVKAAVKDSSLNDGIIKTLTVVPEGVLVKTQEIVILDPKGGTQEETLNSRIPRSDLVPNSPTSTQISVTGMEQVSTLVESVVSGNSLGSLIVQPQGCGEQNMIYMTLPVIATTYLDRTNQWEKVGFEKRNEALKHINTGYQRELKYRKKDGSYAAFPERKASTWLTAYVAKVFSMANNFVAVQTNVICDAVKFLILNAQQPDGMFRENGPVIHGEMTGDVQGAESDASMTAFCLIAMQEARDLCSASVNSLSSSINKAVTYLENRLPQLTNPYAVAMTSYALANENKLNRDILYQFVSPEMSHWPVRKGTTYTLEATAYALLALVKVKAFEDARPVVRWFNKQQKVGGGYGSTQATIIVYQAVSEYWINAKEPEYDLDVDIQVPGRARPDKFKFNKANHYTTRTSKLNEINQDVTVTAKGTGEATLKMVSLYYALPKEKESDCQKFNLTVTLTEDKIDEEERVYWLRIDILYKDRERDATMSILDIGMLTGYTPDTQDLEKLAKGRARTISKYEMDTALSEKGSLIIYLDKVSHTRPEQVRFRIRQTMKVGVLQPAAVSVYEYYEQTHCVKFYHPQRRAGELMRLCRKDECTCAEENCSMQKKGNINNAQRTAKACESTQTSRIDFLYKVRLEKFEDELSTDIYKMRILEAPKEGSFDVGPVGGLRSFLGYQHCRESLDLQEGKTYLIMGTSKDIHRDDNQEFQYVLGEKTWIEYWPTQEECQQDEYRPTCLGMEELVEQYALFGCQQ